MESFLTCMLNRDPICLMIFGRSKLIIVQSKAKNSIQSTSFNKMKKIEQSKGFNESVLSKNHSKKIPFFHLGPKNDWKKIFNEDFIKNVTLKFKPLLKELNYI